MGTLPSTFLYIILFLLISTNINFMNVNGQNVMRVSRQASKKKSSPSISAVLLQCPNKDEINCDRDMLVNIRVSPSFQLEKCEKYLLLDEVYDQKRKARAKIMSPYLVEISRGEPVVMYPLQFTKSVRCETCGHSNKTYGTNDCQHGSSYLDATKGIEDAVPGPDGTQQDIAEIADNEKLYDYDNIEPNEYSERVHETHQHLMSNRALKDLPSNFYEDYDYVADGDHEKTDGRDQQQIDFDASDKWQPLNDLNEVEIRDAKLASLHETHNDFAFEDRTNLDRSARDPSFDISNLDRNKRLGKKKKKVTDKSNHSKTNKKSTLIDNSERMSASTKYAMSKDRKGRRGGNNYNSNIFKDFHKSNNYHSPKRPENDDEDDNNDEDAENYKHQPQKHVKYNNKDSFSSSNFQYPRDRENNHDMDETQFDRTEPKYEENKKSKSHNYDNKIFDDVSHHPNLMRTASNDNNNRNDQVQCSNANCPHKLENQDNFDNYQNNDNSDDHNTNNNNNNNNNNNIDNNNNHENNINKNDNDDDNYESFKSNSNKYFSPYKTFDIQNKEEHNNIDFDKFDDNSNSNSNSNSNPNSNSNSNTPNSNSNSNMNSNFNSNSKMMNFNSKMYSELSPSFQLNNLNTKSKSNSKENDFLDSMKTENTNANTDTNGNADINGNSDTSGKADSTKSLNYNTNIFPNVQSSNNLKQISPDNLEELDPFAINRHFSELNSLNNEEIPDNSKNHEALYEANTEFQKSFDLSSNSLQHHNVLPYTNPQPIPYNPVQKPQYDIYFNNKMKEHQNNAKRGHKANSDNKLDNNNKMSEQNLASENIDSDIQIADGSAIDALDESNNNNPEMSNLENSMKSNRATSANDGHKHTAALLGQKQIDNNLIAARWNRKAKEERAKAKGKKHSEKKPSKDEEDDTKDDEIPVISTNSGSSNNMRVHDWSKAFKKTLGGEFKKRDNNIDGAPNTNPQQMSDIDLLLDKEPKEFLPERVPYNDMIRDPNLNINDKISLLNFLDQSDAKTDHKLAMLDAQMGEVSQDYIPKHSSDKSQGMVFIDSKAIRRQSSKGRPLQKRSYILYDDLTMHDSYDDFDGNYRRDYDSAKDFDVPSTDYRDSESIAQSDDRYEENVQPNKENYQKCDCGNDKSNCICDNKNSNDDTNNVGDNFKKIRSVSDIWYSVFNMSAPLQFLTTRVRIFRKRGNIWRRIAPSITLTSLSGIYANANLSILFSSHVDIFQLKKSLLLKNHKLIIPKELQSQSPQDIYTIDESKGDLLSNISNVDNDIQANFMSEVCHAVAPAQNQTNVQGYRHKRQLPNNIHSIGDFGYFPASMNIIEKCPNDNSRLCLNMLDEEAPAYSIKMRIPFLQNAVVNRDPKIRIATIITDTTTKGALQIAVTVINEGLISNQVSICICKCPMTCGAKTVVKKEITPNVGETVSFLLPFDQTKSNVKYSCDVEVRTENETVVAARTMLIEVNKRCLCIWECNCHCIPSLASFVEINVCHSLTKQEEEEAGFIFEPEDKESRSIASYLPDSRYPLYALLLVFLLGLIKAILGLCSRKINEFGYDYVQPMLKYELASRLRRFVVNTLFFIVLPFIFWCGFFSPKEEDLQVASMEWKLSLDQESFGGSSGSGSGSGNGAGAGRLENNVNNRGSSRLGLRKSGGNDFNYSSHAGVIPGGFASLFNRKDLNDEEVTLLSQHYEPLPLPDFRQRGGCNVNRYQSFTNITKIDPTVDMGHAYTENNQKDVEYVVKLLSKSREAMRSLESHSSEVIDINDPVGMEALKLVRALLGTQIVYRIFNEPVDSIRMPTGRRYAIRGYFLQSIGHGYQFMTYEPLRQHWTIDTDGYSLKRLLPTIDLNSEYFSREYTNKRDVLEAGDLCIMPLPDTPCVNVLVLNSNTIEWLAPSSDAPSIEDTKGNLNNDDDDDDDDDDHKSINYLD